MKSSTFALCSLLLALGAPASRAQVQIDSLTQVKLDGLAAGDLTAAIVQHPAKRNAILDALEARELAAAAEIARLNAALQSATTAHEAAQQARESQIANLESQIAALTTAKDALAAKLAALVPLLEFIEVQSLPTAYKAPLRAARKSDTDRKRELLEAQRSKLEAELTALEAAAAEKQ